MGPGVALGLSLPPWLGFCLAYVATSITDFVAFELVGGLAAGACGGARVAAAGGGAAVAVLGVVGVIDVAMEVAGAMEPGAGADEGGAAVPLRAIVAAGRTVVGSVVVVAVGTGGLGSDTDADLGLGLGGGCDEAETGNGGYGDEFNAVLNAVHGSLDVVGVGWKYRDVIDYRRWR